MQKSNLRIDLLGTSFSMTVDEDPVYLESILGYYRRVIESTKNLTGSGDPLKTAIIAGILLCDEIGKLREKEGIGINAEEITNELNELIKRIDRDLLIDNETNETNDIEQQ